MTLTPSQDALRLTLNWFSARPLSLPQVQALRALPQWREHEEGCMALVDIGESEEVVKAACRAWMVWAQEQIRKIKKKGSSHA